MRGGKIGIQELKVSSAVYETKSEKGEGEKNASFLGKMIWGTHTLLLLLERE